MSELSIDALIAKYDYPVPRYTSFPTAVQFQSNATQDFYKRRLERLDENTPISLYVHIPFCHSLCHYCGCNTKIVNSYSPIESYIENVLQEIDLVGDLMPRRQTVSRIHFGGGSPNYAKTTDIAKIIKAFSAHFDLAEAQIDMECDPRLLTPQKIKDYAALGLSRVSLGVQDFNEGVQKVINRVQPYDLVKTLVENLRKSGIDNINFDLIIGLPKQTPDTIKETLDYTLILAPSRIAVFPYAHVPWMKKHQKLLEKYTLPRGRERFDMAALVQDTLCQNGYKTIGIDHYAKEGDCLLDAQKTKMMRRNFQGYTDDLSRAIMGFGLSSISQFEDGYIQNTTDATLYRKSVKAQKIPVSRGLGLSKDDKMLRALIEQLMCYFKINFEDFKDVAIPFEKLALLAQDGLIEIDHNTLRVTEQGKPFTRIVASCFDPYFNKESGRHAKAV